MQSLPQCSYRNGTIGYEITDSFWYKVHFKLIVRFRFPLSKRKCCLNDVCVESWVRLWEWTVMPNVISRCSPKVSRVAFFWSLFPGNLLYACHCRATNLQICIDTTHGCWPLGRLLSSRSIPGTVPDLPRVLNHTEWMSAWMNWWDLFVNALTLDIM